MHIGKVNDMKLRAGIFKRLDDVKRCAEEIGIHISGELQLNGQDCMLGEESFDSITIDMNTRWQSDAALSERTDDDKPAIGRA